MQRSLWVKWSAIALSVVVSVFLLLSPSVATAQAITTYRIDYQAVQASIVSESAAVAARLRLPQTLVYEATTGSTNQIFVGVGGITTVEDGAITTGYQVNIVDDPQACSGALSCTIAYASGEIITPDMGAVEDQFAWMLEPGGLDAYQNTEGSLPQWVSLPEGKRVYLVPWVFGGAGAGWEQAVWDEDTYRYTIALKNGEPAWVMQMVESIGESVNAPN